MSNISLEMIWKRLEDLHSGQAVMLQRLDSLDQKVGSSAQTLLGQNERNAPPGTHKRSS
jgi:hypothetical protein